MNKDNLKNNLLKSINKIDNKINLDSNEVLFKILPLEENNKKRNSIDDIIYNGTYKNLHSNNVILTIEKVLNFLILYDGKIPALINIKLIDRGKDKVIFLLEVSMRFRKEKELLKNTYDFIPFKIVKP